MASLAVASSVNIAASAASLSGARLPTASRNGAAVSVKMVVPVRCQAKNDAEIVQRRAVVAGAAAAAIFSVLSNVSAMAEKEPKPGSAAAKKKYANICVSNATASICHG